MSNLIKSVYFNFDTKATRSIDSDERIEEFIPDIFEEKKEEPSFEQLNVAALSGADRTDQMFDNGIPVISMDDVVSQEREKLQSELQEEQESILAKAKEEAEKKAENQKKKEFYTTDMSLLNQPEDFHISDYYITNKVIAGRWISDRS